MTTAMQPAGGGAAGRPSPTGLADVIDTILDKGLVIDAYMRVSVAGIELLTIDARIVVASVDTYLRFAEAVNRLGISQDKEGLREPAGDMQGSGARHTARGALEAAGGRLREFADAGSQQGRSQRPRSRGRS
jgi:hypothetical protein